MDELIYWENLIFIRGKMRKTVDHSPSLNSKRHNPLLHNGIKIMGREKQLCACLKRSYAENFDLE